MTTTIPNTPTIKDPDALLDYPLDWGPWLASTGDGTDQLASCTVSVFLEDEVTVPTGGSALAVSGVASVSTGDGDVTRYALVRLTGGVPGVVYAVRYRVTTVDGLVDDRTRFVKVRQR